MNEGEDMYRLLIVEDDKGIAEAIKAQAEIGGHDTERFS